MDTNSTLAPRLGDRQVNSTDYEGRIVIEKFSYVQFADDPIWAVPAWEEQGHPDLAGPFDTVEQACATLKAEDY